MRGKVYLLRNPLDDTVFYVGQTIYKLSERFRGHLFEKGNSTKVKIISEIIEKKLVPVIEELESMDYNNDNVKLLNERELFWIKHYNPIGNRLHVLFFVKKCIMCGNDFESKRERAIYCSDLCRAKSGQKNKTQEVKKQNNSPKFKKNEKCEYCKNDLDAINRNKRFCSAKCRVYWSREKDKIKKEMKGIEKPILKKELTKGELFKLIRDGKI
jgi:hypothetical protein